MRKAEGKAVAARKAAPQHVGQSAPFSIDRLHITPSSSSAGAGSYPGAARLRAQCACHAQARHPVKTCFFSCVCCCFFRHTYTNHYILKKVSRSGGLRATKLAAGIWVTQPDKKRRYALPASRVRRANNYKRVGGN